MNLTQVLRTELRSRMRGEAELTKALGERVVRVEARASTAEKAVGRRALPVNFLCET